MEVIERPSGVRGRQLTDDTSDSERSLRQERVLYVAPVSHERSLVRSVGGRPSPRRVDELGWPDLHHKKGFAMNSFPT